MPTKPPRCPDCSSATVRPFVVPTPEERRRYQAELRDAVLERAAQSGQYPAWECLSCGQCFGDGKQPNASLPARTPTEWAELIKSMLPQPVTTNESGELLGGAPALVMIRITAAQIVIMEAGWSWAGSHHVVRKGRPFAKVPTRTSPARVAELIALAWGKRLSQHRWCLRCQRRGEPEFTDGPLCSSCAERVLGIVH